MTSFALFSRVCWMITIYIVTASIRCQLRRGHCYLFLSLPISSFKATFQNRKKYYGFSKWFTTSKNFQCCIHLVVLWWIGGSEKDILFCFFRLLFRRRKTKFVDQKNGFSRFKVQNWNIKQGLKSAESY